MKKKYIIISAILMLVALEIYLFNRTTETLYPDINEALKEIETGNNDRIVWHLENISINGKNYKEISFLLEEKSARIVRLKTDGDVLELPQSLELIGALAFGESQIDEIKVANNKMCMEWDVFWGTKHQKNFPESSLANLSQINEKFYKTYHLD